VLALVGAALAFLLVRSSDFVASANPSGAQPSEPLASPAS
jgi:hypothetical protein